MTDVPSQTGIFRYSGIPYPFFLGIPPFSRFAIASRHILRTIIETMSSPRGIYIIIRTGLGHCRFIRTPLEFVKSKTFSDFINLFQCRNRLNHVLQLI